jgi:hypothetical protein
VSEDNTQTQPPAPQQPVAQSTCPTCSYSLAGLATSTCPECGTTIASPQTLDPSLVVSQVNCERCSYDLRGITVGSMCPECNLPVQVSVGLSRTATLDPEGARLLQSGSKLVVRSLMGFVLGYIGIVAVSIAAGLGLSALNLGGMAPRSFSLFALIPIAFAACTLLTMYFASQGYKQLAESMSLMRVLGEKQKDPVTTYSNAQIRMMIVAAGSGVLALVCFGATLLFQIFQRVIDKFVVAGVCFLVLGVACFAAAQVCGAIRFFYVCILLRKIAQRIPDASLASHAQRMLWLGPVLICVGWLLGCIIVIGYPLMLIAYALHLWGFFRLSKLLNAQYRGRTVTNELVLK